MTINIYLQYLAVDAGQFSREKTQEEAIHQPSRIAGD
jgi:hypothetical protein